MLLEVDHIDVFYDHIQALHQVDLSLKAGQIVALIGANGAGKTTLLKAISGIQRPRKGSIRFENRELAGLNPAGIVKLGISQAPEGRRVFPQMTVLENLEMGAYLLKGHRGELQQRLSRVYEIFPILEERSGQLALTLSGGEQQMLTIGRALMSKPRLLLLDEPSLGLAPNLVKTIFEIIKGIKEQNISILLVEQNSFMALSVADQGYVLENGRITLSGKGRDLANHPKIKESYLGKEIVYRRKQKGGRARQFSKSP
jgi:branched-chain amino acid transport system ATP-binding protein